MLLLQVDMCVYLKLAARYTFQMRSCIETIEDTISCIENMENISELDEEDILDGDQNTFSNVSVTVNVLQQIVLAGLVSYVAFSNSDDSNLKNSTSASSKVQSLTSVNSTILDTNTTLTTPPFTSSTLSAVVVALLSFLTSTAICY